MQSLMKLIAHQQGQLVAALGQHLVLSLVSLLIAAVIALPLAMALKDHRRLGELILQITGIFQTIPSLALLGLLIPIVGIGTVPAVIALVLYAMMPIYQNAYTGLTTIDPQLEEAGLAFGLSWWTRLKRYELPLALPLIFSGLRIALVMIIGTATLAALIGAGGLGTYILLGIQQNNNGELLLGAGLSAFLALLSAGLLKWVGKSRRNLKIGGVVLAGLLVCGGAVTMQRHLVHSQPDTIVIAGKMGGEPNLLIHMYKDLIEEAAPQTKVVLKPNFGGTSFLYAALQRDQIDIYPEFTGTVLEGLAKQKRTPKSPDQAYQAARRYLARQGMTYLKPMAYQNGYALAVTASFAKQHRLATISDLVEQQAAVTAGFDPDFAQQPDGYLGLQKAYDLKVGTVKTMEPTLRYQALVQGKVELVDGYTTDPQLRQYHLRVLADDRHFFPPYQGAPLMKARFAKTHPVVVKQLNKLAGQITTNEMQEMNYAVTVKHQKASVVAHQYLRSHHLITK